jgi:putative spermidine/putrescine transport system permease protein
MSRGSIVLSAEAAQAERDARSLDLLRRLARALRSVSRLTGYGWLTLVMVFIYAPILVVIASSFDPGRMVQLRAVLRFPPQGFTLHWYAVIDAASWASLWLSLKLASLAAAAATVLGVPAALGLVRGRFPGKALVDSVFRAPLQIPFIVISIAFLQSYFALSAATGIVIQGTFLGLFLGHLFVALPYVVGSVGASLQRVSPRLEEAALILGAPRWRVLWRVTLPLIVPGICGGLLYAFLISFTDVTLSVFLAGNDTIPFPVRVFTSVITDMEPTIPAISSLVFLASIVLVYIMQRLLGMDTLLRSGGSSS